MKIVDCDLHQGYASKSDITKYLPKHFEYRGMTVPTINYAHPGGMGRPSAMPDDVEDFEFIGSDYTKIKENHLDKHSINYVLLTGPTLLSVSATTNRDYAYELAKAYNEFMIEEWLPKDDRFLGSLLVAIQNPEKSAEMVREYGDHPRVAEVLIQGASSRLPFGHPFYWPVYEAATDLDLPVSIHVSKEGHGITDPVTGAGHPNTYLEWHSIFPTVYLGQLASMIFEGVPIEFPEINIVMKEGGYSWLPFLMWRMDDEWRSARSQVPWLEKKPSEYIYDHFKFTTQPTHMPDDPNDLMKILDIIDAEKLLMFSSDYPHWDADSPEHALPNLSDSVEKKIYYENAEDVYSLG